MSGQREWTESLDALSVIDARKVVAVKGSTSSRYKITADLWALLQCVSPSDTRGVRVRPRVVCPAPARRCAGARAAVTHRRPRPRRSSCGGS